MNLNNEATRDDKENTGIRQSSNRRCYMHVCLFHYFFHPV